MSRLTPQRLDEDRYERLLSLYELLLPAYLDALAELHQLRDATRLLVAAACRTAGEYGIPVRSVNGPVRPLTTDVPALLGTATYRALLLIPEP